MNTSRRYPIKINVNFALSFEIENFCKSVNQAMVEEGLDSINFNNFTSIPHITLLMGNVKSANDYSELIQIYSNFVKSQSRIEYSISRPYWKEPLKKFVFVDVLPLDKFEEFRLNLDKNTKGLIDYSSYGGPDSSTHITLGYSNLENLDNNLISSFLPPSLGIADLMRICKAGNHGTCSEIFNNFNLSLNKI